MFFNFQIKRSFLSLENYTFYFSLIRPAIYPYVIALLK